jgi:glutamine amidotransferase
MSAADVVIVDYGSGNLHSIQKAFESRGVATLLTSRPEEVEAATRLVIPGVGAFGDCVSRIGDLGLAKPILRCIESGRPVLGICVGMQMLFDRSEEFGVHEGFGLIPGAVTALSSRDASGNAVKIPHVGWSELRPPAGTRWDGTILANVIPGACVYFVHSYHAVPERWESCLAETHYGHQRICAVARSGNLYGCQFHPEKSGEVGLRIIEAFAALDA